MNVLPLPVASAWRRTKSVAVMLTSVFAFSATASAQTYQEPRVSFTHAGLQYVHQNLDTPNCHQNGLSVYGSMDIQDGWFVRGSLTDASGNRGCGSTTTSFGGGYSTVFNEIFDMYGSLSFESMSPDHGSNESGVALVAGLRGFVATDLEAKLQAMHSTTFSETGFMAGVAYWFKPQIAATVDAEISSDATTIAIGGRINF